MREIEHAHSYSTELIRITWLTKSLLGFLSVTLMAVAGAFWEWATVVDNSAKMISNRLGTIEAKQEAIAQQYQDHTRQKWHDYAGEKIIRLEERFQVLSNKAPRVSPTD